MKNKTMNFNFLGPIIMVIILVIASGLFLFYNKTSGKATTLPPGCTKEILAGESINKYSSTAVPGDIICIHAGTYTATLTPKVSGTAAGKITFKAYPGDECQGDSSAKGQQLKTGCKVKLDGAKSRSLVDFGGQNYIRVEGLDLGNGNDNAVINGAYLELVNNYIHDGLASGITSKQADTVYISNHILVENNEVVRMDVFGIRFYGLNNGADLSRGHYITLRGNNIHDTADDPIRDEFYDSIIENNQIHTMGRLGGDTACMDCHADCIQTERVDNLIIRNNIIYDCTQLIYLAPNTDGFTRNVQIYGNILYTNLYATKENGGAPGVFLSGPGSANNVYIYSNTCGWLGPGDSSQGYKCIEVSPPATNIVVRNNIMYDSHAGFDTTVNSDYNLYFCSYSPTDPNGCDLGYFGSTPWTSLKSKEPNSIYADPKFMNYQRSSSWNFHLQQGSSAIDRWTASAFSGISIPNPLTDPDGVSRPQGSAYDIGAYEFGSAICTPSCSGKQCGSDGCSGSCGTCSPGYTCNNVGQCISSCTPKTCSQLGKQCGSWSDGCTSTLNCGTCSSGTCSTNGQCVASCVENWQCTVWSTCTSGTQTRTCTDLNSCGTTINKPATQQTCTPIGCSLSSLSWQNQPTSTQTGTFRIEFDVTAKTSTMDMVFGLSNNPPLTYASLGPIVIFNNKGIIQARNSATYQADLVLAYTSGKTYHVGMDISLAAKTYSVDITPSGSAKVQLAKNYAFRKEQATLSTINNFAFIEGYANSVGSNICNVKITSIIPEDFNADGRIDGADLNIMASAFGTKSGDTLYNRKCDLNSDGFVDVVDLQMFVAKLPK